MSRYDDEMDVRDQALADFADVPNGDATGLVLYRVTVRRVYEALVLAPDAATAEGFAEEIVGDQPIERTEVEAYPIGGNITPPPGWGDRALVYHPGDESITVTEVRRRSDL